MSLSFRVSEFQSFLTLKTAVNKTTSPQGPFCSCSGAFYRITQSSSVCLVDMELWVFKFPFFQALRMLKDEKSLKWHIKMEIKASTFPWQLDKLQTAEEDCVIAIESTRTTTKWTLSRDCTCPVQMQNTESDKAEKQCLTINYICV